MIIMKKTFSLLVMSLFVLSVAPSVLAVSVGTGVGIDLITEDFAPRVWMCDGRTFADDMVEPQLYGLPRHNNYAFEGESVTWDVLVMDKNGKEKIMDVFATIGDVQGEGNDIEVNCVRTGNTVSNPYQSCEATILEERITSFNPDLMAMYTCTLTVETPESMEGEYWLTVEAEDMDGLTGTMAQNEYWFLNPVIALSIDGDLTFEDVRPGSVARSSTMLIGNDAEDGSGVILDMFISGTDFYDSASSGAMCPTTNKLALSQFTYDVSNGQFLSEDQSIRYGDTIAQAGRIMDHVLFGNGAENVANMLAPGAEMAITFQLDLPEPCNGDFDTGSIYFWGEAI
jgi:hypothetical protein